LVNLLVFKVLTDHAKMSRLVSIIMPCFNSAETISCAIDSVLSQEFCDFELIIIDDGSRDASFEIAAVYASKDARIKLIRNRGDKGVAGARNSGIEIAIGRFICFLDSDDYLLPMAIARRVDYLIENDVCIVFGGYLRLLPDGCFVDKVAKSKVSFRDMLKRNHIGNLTGMYDAKRLGKIFQKKIGHEDYLMWLDLLKSVDYAYSVGLSPIAVYRVSKKSLSGNKANAFLWHWIIIRHEMLFCLSCAMYYQACYSIYSLMDRLKIFLVTRFK
jgi:glycosyltransferase involved in cell wall biosynthesis